ncbi:MAG: hypothetical protein IT436_01005 [Phycisphaerales bacterium]|nr:hypothetical protein [Phycisphaerales bacterium]
MIIQFTPHRFLPAAALACAGAATALGQSYTITELGTLYGPATAQAVNNSGVAVGTSTDPTAHFRAVRWDGGLTSLGGLPGLPESAATALDNAGRIFAVGYSFNQIGGSAFAWDSGFITPLGAFEPRGCNDAGAVVGSTYTATSGLWFERACVYSAGTLTVLATLGGSAAEAYDIDAAGRIVGSSFTLANTTPHACLWIGGAPRDLGGLGGARAQAFAINDDGFIAGCAELPAGAAHGVLYRIDAAGNVLSRTDLGTLRTGASSFATGVNAAGEVVGISDGRAFLWTDGALTDLNTLIDPAGGWRLDVAAAISDAGAIVGWGFHDGLPRAFIMTPGVPCPADLNGDGIVDFADYLEFLNFYDAQDLRVDFNHDGIVDFADYLEFLNLYDAGC